jgi:hypothetical protein
VSLLWPNQHQLLVAIGAEQFCLILRTGFAKNIVAKHHESYEKSASEQPWLLGIQRLAIQLEALNLPQNTQLSLTLASDLVRYIILPGHEIAMSSDEKLGYALASFREVYGVNADSWKISIDDTAPTKPTLACAIDMSMYEAIVELEQQYKLKLKSIQPYLMTTFNKLFSSIKNANASFVVIEQTRMATLFLQNGEYQQVYVERFTDDWQTNLEETLLRNQLLTNQPPKELMIYAPTQTTIKHELSKNVSCKRLSVKTKNDALPTGFAMLEALA